MRMNHSSLDEVLAEADQWRRDHRWLARWKGLRYRLRSAWVALRQEPRHRYERARYGASYKDIWGFDVYIAGVIAHACDRLKEGYSYPSEMTPESWAEYLDGIARDLRRWQTAFADTMPYEEERAAYEAAVAAMHRFADRFGSFWD
jgi:hypothetical protein